MATRKQSRPSTKAGTKRVRPTMLIGVEVPKPTRQQARLLERIFRANTIAVLGSAKGLGYTNWKKMVKRVVGER